MKFVYEKLYIYGIYFSLWKCCHLKIIQVDLLNKSIHRIIFSQCGGLSLRLYLSRPDEVYQRSQFDNI
jgi:hypothetical protein